MISTLWCTYGINYNTVNTNTHWLDYIRQDNTNFSHYYLNWGEVFPFVLWNIWKNRNHNNHNNTSCNLEWPIIIKQSLEYKLMTEKAITNSTHKAIKVKKLLQLALNSYRPAPAPPCLSSLILTGPPNFARTFISLDFVFYFCILLPLDFLVSSSSLCSHFLLNFVSNLLVSQLSSWNFCFGFFLNFSCNFSVSSLLK